MHSSNAKLNCGCSERQTCPNCVSKDVIPVSVLHAELDEIEIELGRTPRSMFRRLSAAQEYAESIDGNPDGNTVELPRYGHYFKPCPFPLIDVYRVLKLFEVSDPCLQHAVKKLLCTGTRGHKNAEKDVQEAIASLQRWQVMRKEEADSNCPRAPTIRP